MPTTRATLSLLSLATICSTLLPALAVGQDKPKKERDVIGHDELVEADAKFPDLYEAVKRLRPHFLTQNRGPREMGVSGSNRRMCDGASLEPNCSQRTSSNVVILPVIYLDGMKSGDPESLKGLRTNLIDEVRYLSPSQAAMDYGLGHDGGAILVKRSKSIRP